MMKGLALLMCFVSLLTATPAFATDKTPEMIGDLVVSRPLGIAATIAGAAMFVLALPFAATSRSVKKTAHELVRKPFYYTFERPLGEYTSRYIDPSPSLTGCGGNGAPGSEGAVAAGGRTMPIYEFFCSDCNTIFNFFSARVNTEKRPLCPKCGKGPIGRLVSRVSVLRGLKESDDMGMPDLDESKIEKAMSLLERKYSEKGEYFFI